MDLLPAIILGRRAYGKMLFLPEERAACKRPQTNNESSQMACRCRCAGARNAYGDNQEVKDDNNKDHDTTKIYKEVFTEDAETQGFPV